jgi:hypothetical protein
MRQTGSTSQTFLSYSEEQNDFVQGGAPPLPATSSQFELAAGNSFSSGAIRD